MSGDEFTIWRCPKCGVRGWTTEPNGHVPSSHTNAQGETCHTIPDKTAVRAALAGPKESGRPRPDYDPHIDHPERFTRGI